MGLLEVIEMDSYGAGGQQWESRCQSAGLFSVEAVLKDVLQILSSPWGGQRSLLLWLLVGALPAPLPCPQGLPFAVLFVAPFLLRILELRSMLIHHP